MAWPWPLDGVEKWFQSFWDWVGKAAVTAVSVVSDWVWSAIGWLRDRLSEVGAWLQSAFEASIEWMFTRLQGTVSWVWDVVRDALGGLWAQVSEGLGNVWNSVSAGLSGLWVSVSGALGDFWNSVSSALGQVQAGLIGFFTDVWNNLSGAIGEVGNTLWQGITSLGGAISSGLGSLWTNISGFFSRLWSDVSGGINMIGGAIGGAVNTIGTWVSDALKGVAAALGLALQQVLGWLWNGLTAAAGAIANALKAIMDTVGAIISPIILGFVDMLRGAFSKGSPDKKLEEAVTKMMDATRTRILDEIKQTHKSPWTPEAILRADQVIAGTVLVAQVAVHSAAAAASIEIMGTKIKLTNVVEKAIDTLGLKRVVGASFALPVAIGLLQPLRYAYNDMFRPRIPDTRTADQMLFEENIAEPEWRQIYRYQGWRESDIDAWFKTMWREPSLLVLRNLVLDPDVDEEWVRKKMREGGLIGEDADAIIAYGKRQSLKDERSALASQVQADLIDGVIVEVDARADLQALKFTPGEIDYRIARCTLIVARNERRAALKAVKNFTEADLKAEVSLGLRTRDQFVADMDTIGFSAAIAQRKYVLITTSKPLSAAEVEARRTVVQNKIVKTGIRFDLALSRLDKQTALISSELEAASTELKETLDVIDVETNAIKSQLAGITPEIVTAPIRQRIAATRLRYERALLLLDQREARLVSDIEDTKTIMSETLDVIDVETIFLSAELAEVGVAS